jgi:transposase
VLAYDHFLLGRDTAAIAEMMGVSESIVLRWITVERSKRRGLPNPFEEQE